MAAETVASEESIKNARPGQSSGPVVLQRTLLATPASVGVARDVVRGFCLEQRVPDHVMDQARLCVSELATNSLAVTPAGEAIGLRLSLAPGSLTVGVWDPCDELPAEPDVSPWTSLADIDAAEDDEEFGGWGLRLAREGAGGYSCVPVEGGGKRVFARFDWAH